MASSTMSSHKFLFSHIHSAQVEWCGNWQTLFLSSQSARVGWGNWDRMCSLPFRVPIGASALRMESELSACSPPYTSNLMGSSHTCYFLSSMCHTHSLFISSPVPFAIPPDCRLLYFRLFSGTAFLYAHWYLSDYPLVWFSKLRQVSCYLVVELHCKHIKYMKIQLYAHKFLNKISVNRITHHSVQ